MVELLLAVAILAFVFAGAMTLVARGFGVMDDSRLNTLAGQVLQSEMETLRLLNWAELSALAASETFSAEAEFAEAGFNRFTCTREIEADGTSMKKVTLTATWDSTNGQRRERSYVTFISQDGLNDYYVRSF